MAKPDRINTGDETLLASPGTKFDDSQLGLKLAMADKVEGQEEVSVKEYLLRNGVLDLASIPESSRLGEVNRWKKLVDDGYGDLLTLSIKFQDKNSRKVFFDRYSDFLNSMQAGMPPTFNQEHIAQYADPAVLRSINSANLSRDQLYDLQCSLFVMNKLRSYFSNKSVPINKILDCNELSVITQAILKRYGLRTASFLIRTRDHAALAFEGIAIALDPFDGKLRSESSFYQKYEGDSSRKSANTHGKYYGLATLINDLATEKASNADLNDKLQILVLDFDSSDADYLYNGAIAYLKKQQYAKTNSLAEKLIRMNPNAVSAWKILADSSMRMGNYALAINAYRKLLELDPSNANTSYNLGVCYLKTNLNSQEAIRCFSEALENHFDSPVECYKNMMQIYFINLRNYPKVIENATKALALNPKDVYSLYCSGTAYMRMNQFDLAAKSLKGCLALDPNHKEARGNLHITYMNAAIASYNARNIVEAKQFFAQIEERYLSEEARSYYDRLRAPLSS